jgi:hypothetical protein
VSALLLKQRTELRQTLAVEYLLIFPMHLLSSWLCTDLSSEHIEVASSQEEEIWQTTHALIEVVVPQMT